MALPALQHPAAPNQHSLRVLHQAASAQRGERALAQGGRPVREPVRERSQARQAWPH